MLWFLIIRLYRDKISKESSVYYNEPFCVKFIILDVSSGGA